jgi:aspartyl-tRNA(Asn)/glutamyl-tRNA(Gln) amidotransferase subunit C
MALSPEEVRWVAHLARLELSDPELEAMAQQLGAILDYVDLLQRIDTTGIEPLAHPLPLSNVFRDDAPIDSLPVDAAMANAPDRRGDFYAVPAVLD